MKKELDGTLSSESFLIIHKIVKQRSFEEFQIQRDNLTQLRLEAFKNKDWSKYDDCML